MNTLTALEIDAVRKRPSITRTELSELSRKTTRAIGKLNNSIRLAKSCVQDFIETKDKRFIQIRKEAMQDARYWKSQLN